MTETCSMQGGYVINVFDAETGIIIKTYRIKNALMAINQTIRMNMLSGVFTGDKNALALRYFAFGTGTTPVTQNDIKLSNEVFRKQITQITQIQSQGSVRSVVSLGSDECNVNIREIGVFAGSSATTARNSGTLISRVLVDIPKNTNIVLNIVRTDTCTI